jgi:hypothetical protein
MGYERESEGYRLEFRAGGLKEGKKNLLALSHIAHGVMIAPCVSKPNG